MTDENDERSFNKLIIHQSKLIIHQISSVNQRLVVVSMLGSPDLAVIIHPRLRPCRASERLAERFGVESTSGFLTSEWVSLVISANGCHKIVVKWFGG